jgi:hypothetical protein
VACGAYLRSLVTEQGVAAAASPAALLARAAFPVFSCRSGSSGSSCGGSSRLDTSNSSIDFGGRGVVHDEVLREDAAFRVVLVVAGIAFSRGVGSLVSVSQKFPSSLQRDMLGAMFAIYNIGENLHCQV